MDLSIMVLTYNEEKYISQALDSILNQKTKYNYEIVVSDDCSTDNTASIIAEYQRKYPDKIRAVLRKKNVGAEKNGIEAMKLLTGRYYMFLEGDDYWLPDKIEKQLDLMNAHPEIGLCYGQIHALNEKTNSISSYKSQNMITEFNEIVLHNPANTCTQCGRLELYKRYYDEVKPESHGWLMGDYPQVLWYAKNSQIYAFEDAFAVYRIRVGSLSHPSNIEKNLAFTKSTMEIQKYFAEDDSLLNKIEEIYNASVAENYWIFGDMKKYRICYKEHLKAYGRNMDTVKFFISYIPFAGRVVRVYVRTRNYKI